VVIGDGQPVRRPRPLVAVRRVAPSPLGERLVRSPGVVIQAERADTPAEDEE
jgi:hypothetical protein